MPEHPPAIGRYQVKRKLAEGGMAEIFLAAATGPEGFEKEVVIKRIRSFLSKDQTFIEMFKAEARLASRLNHANIVQIFDFAMHEDTYFIAMEFVRGGSLWELRRRCREIGVPFPPALVAEIGSQVARGLHYAHQLMEKGKLIGLVHRDVTPHNVLLGFDGAVKLTDFGIAKAGTSFTAPGMLKGKFAYMSPEQGRGESVDARTDVFALGVVLWEMLTGGRLFEGESDIAVLRAVQFSEIAPPARLNPDVPDELSQVVMKALARPLEQRHQTAQELERALAVVALHHAKSVEDVNVGAFVRQIFKDELEAEKEAEAAHQQTESKTPGPVEVSLGTIFKDRSGEHQARSQSQSGSGVTPQNDDPSRPGTDLMPGIKPSQRRVPVFDNPDDSSAARTDTLSDVHRPKTDVMPARRRLMTHAQEQAFTPIASAKPDAQPTPSISLGDTPTDRERGDFPRRELLLEPSEAPTARPGDFRTLSNEAPTAKSDDFRALEPRRSMTPYLIVGGLLVVGVVGGVVGSSMLHQKTVDVPLVQEMPLPKPVAAPPPQEAVVAKPAEKAPVPVPEPEPEPVKAAEPVKTTAPAPTAPVKLKTAPAGRARGTLLVNAKPWATVFVDDREVGDASPERHEFSVPVGVHKVTLQHTKKTETYQVEIKPGAQTLVEFNAL
ncbi:MAG: protein kinase [Myxococcaceae bacterium]